MSGKQTDLLHQRQKPPLSEWLDRMARMTGHESGAALVAETGVCCWLDYYENDYTPGEAFSEECSE